MAKSSDHDFGKRQFETGGNLPGLWWESAYSLLAAADVLDGFIGYLGDQMQSDRPITQQRWDRMSVVKVSYMLRAMATECLLKALWLKQGGTLTKHGQYVGLLKKNEHRLHKLADALSNKGHISFSTRELELLEQASYWINFGPLSNSNELPIPRSIYPNGWNRRSKAVLERRSASGTKIADRETTKRIGFSDEL